MRRRLLYQNESFFGLPEPGNWDFRTIILPNSLLRGTCHIWRDNLVMYGDRGGYSDTSKFDNTIEIFNLWSETVNTITFPTDGLRRIVYSNQIWKNNLYIPLNLTGNSTLGVYDLAGLSYRIIATAGGGATKIWNDKLIRMGGSYNINLFDFVSESVDTFMASPYTLASSLASQIWNDKLYIPNGNGSDIQIFDLNSKILRSVPLQNNMMRDTSQIWNNRLYMPRRGGVQLEIFNLGTETPYQTINLLASRLRYTSQVWNDKLIIPESSGTILEIFDMNAGTTREVTLPINTVRLTSIVGTNNVLYLPEWNGDRLLLVNLTRI